MKFLIIFAALFICVSAKNLYQNHLIAEPYEDNDGRITIGQKAATGQIPYQVGLMVKVSLGYSWCGGSLIHSDWVLTAAHCLSSAKSVTVYLGATNRGEPELELEVPKENLIYHSSFSSRTVQNDIGLIKLPSSVQMTRKIQIKDLPSASDVSRNLTGEGAIVSGSGKTSDSTSVETYLQYVTLRISDGSVCKKKYRTSFNDKNICIDTSDDNKSTCQGDSGGPLVLVTDGVQVGIVSYGSSSGCEKGQPIGFTRVASLIDWVNEKTGLNF